MKPSNFCFSNIYVVDNCITVAGTKFLENIVKKLNFAHFVCLHGENLKEKPFFVASIAIYHYKSNLRKTNFTALHLFAIGQSLQYLMTAKYKSGGVQIFVF